MPASSKLTNYLNICIEIGYLVIETLLYWYFKLKEKPVDVQYGFGIALVVVEIIILFTIFIWMLYRFVTMLKSTDVWKYISIKLN